MHLSTKLSLITADYLDAFSLPPAHVAERDTDCIKGMQVYMK